MQGTEGKKSKSRFVVLRDCSSILNNKLHSKDINLIFMRKAITKMNIWVVSVCTRVFNKHIAVICHHTEIDSLSWW